jgi:hypothetical protein
VIGGLVPAARQKSRTLHLANKGIYYSFGVFDGDGQSFRNVDSNLAPAGRPAAA